MRSISSKILLALLFALFVLNVVGVESVWAQDYFKRVERPAAEPKAAPVKAAPVKATPAKVAPAPVQVKKQDAEEENRKALEALKARVAELESKLAKAVEEREAVKNEIAELKALVSRLKGSVNEDKPRPSLSPEQEKELVRLQSELKDTKDKIAGLESAVADGLDRELVAKTLAEQQKRQQDLEAQIQKLYAPRAE